MSTILITGGTGMLGSALRQPLIDAGYTVRIMSRRQPREEESDGVQWAQAQLASGEGLAEAVKGVDGIIHAASSPFKNMQEVDVDGTRRLLDVSANADVSHFCYVSIVGIDRIPFVYYKYKLLAEQVVQAGNVPWTILRATQFHYFLDMIIGTLSKLPVAFLPTDFKFQTIATGEVADHLVTLMDAGPVEFAPDIGGPQVMTMRDMADMWMAARGESKPIIKLPTLPNYGAAFRAGYNTCPDMPVGHQTWQEWLAERYQMTQAIKEREVLA